MIKFSNSSFYRVKIYVWAQKSHNIEKIKIIFATVGEMVFMKYQPISYEDV